MITVTLSDLRHRGGKYLDAVERGESIEVCRKGKAVALLSPLRKSNREYWKQVKPAEMDGVELSRAILEEREEGL